MILHTEVSTEYGFCQLMLTYLWLSQIILFLTSFAIVIASFFYYNHTGAPLYTESEKSATAAFYSFKQFICHLSPVVPRRDANISQTRKATVNANKSYRGYTYN